MKISKLLLSITATLLSASFLTACNSGGSNSNGPIIDAQTIINEDKDPIFEPNSRRFEKIELKSKEFQGVNYYSNELVTSPNNTDWINSDNQQYKFPYKAPLIQNYDTSSYAFLTPLVVKQQYESTEVYLVIQPKLNYPHDNSYKNNVIVKYHSLYNGGENIYTPEAHRQVAFNIISIDGTQKNTTQSFDVYSHAGLWSGADNNTDLKTAFFDDKSHIIVSKMIDKKNNKRILSVNVLLSDDDGNKDELEDVKAFLQISSNLARFAYSFGDHAPIMKKALSTYNELLKSQCNIYFQR